MEQDQVVHPNHYNKGEFEVVEVLSELGDGPGYVMGAILKYLVRAEGKLDSAGYHDPALSIDKAVFWATYLIPIYKDDGWSALSGKHRGIEQIIELDLKGRVVPSERLAQAFGCRGCYAEALARFLDVTRAPRHGNGLVNAKTIKALKLALENLAEYLRAEEGATT